MNDNGQIRKDNRGGMFQGVADHLVLLWRLWNDNRVNPFLKLLPISSLVYLISPFDLPTPIDDLGVIWGFTYAFIELCPPDVVAEHREAIAKRRQVGGQASDTEARQGEVIDAEFRQKE